MPMNHIGRNRSKRQEPDRSKPQAAAQAREAGFQDKPPCHSPSSPITHPFCPESIPVPLPLPDKVPECEKKKLAVACAAEPLSTGPSDLYHDAPQYLHSQTVGENGPVLLQDTALHETLEKFVHEKTVERAVHAKGYGAFGTFAPYRCMRDVTALCFLQEPGQRVPVSVRYSLAAGSRGTPDTSRNIWGFCTKFYTKDGVFDLLCNHIPVFAVRDAIRYPEAIRALSPSPVHNMADPARLWDFVARTPEALHFITWLYSDVGTVKNLRCLRSYGVNTYVWRNVRGQPRYVKYHWVPAEGTEFITHQDAQHLMSIDPDCAGRGLYDTIAAGQPVEYELSVQLMEPEQAEKLDFDPLDDTKIWAGNEFPLIPVGRMTLDRNPENYAAEVEKIAFSPSNLLPGTELSADKMLQGRSFIYHDAQRRRLGPDYREIPINCGGNLECDSGNYVTSGADLTVEGGQVRKDLVKTSDFAQAGEYYWSLDDTGRDHLVDNLAEGLSRAKQDTRNTVLNHVWQADRDFAERLGARIKEYGAV